MKFSIILFFMIFLFQFDSICQTNAEINDVDFYLEDNYVVVNYTIIGAQPKEHMTIELRFITEDNKLIIPQNITGDVGTNLFGDGKKTIRWDIVKDQILLSGNLKAIVNIASTKILYGGPSNALLSVVVPGLGGYFVEKNKIRSIATTISTLGLLGYGISQKKLSDKYYSDYNESTEPSEIEDLYNKANSAHHRYYISTRIAAGIWIFDIIWVTIKGFQNLKESKSFYDAFDSNGLNLIYVNNGLQLKYSISF
jgi:hypothetical protein